MMKVMSLLMEKSWKLKLKETKKCTNVGKIKNKAEEVVREE